MGVKTRQALAAKCFAEEPQATRKQERPMSLEVILYVQVASDRVGRVLRRFNCTSFKPTPDST